MMPLMDGFEGCDPDDEGPEDGMMIKAKHSFRGLGSYMSRKLSFGEL